MFIQLLHGLQSVINKFTGRILINSNNDIITNDSGYIIVIADQTSVKIGDREYPTYRYGNKVWMQEYLDYQWSGLSVGSGASISFKYASYYMNDETTYGYNGQKLGLLYNGYAIRYLEENKSTLLPEGWRVATKDDYLDLFNNLTYNQLTDSNTFNFKTSGIYNPQVSDFTLTGTRIWTSTLDTSATPNCLYMANMTPVSKALVSNTLDFEVPVRLVKDIN